MASVPHGIGQLVQLATVYAPEPNIIILDEPSLGLAPIAVNTVGKALVELRRRGRSLLLVQQRVDLALQVCDRLYVLTEGRIAREDRAESVNPEERSLIDAYLG